MKTYCGGLVTLVVGYITLVFAATKLVGMQQKKNPSINNYSRRHAFLNEENYSIKDEKFMMAFTLENYFETKETHDHDDRFIKWFATY